MKNLRASLIIPTYNRSAVLRVAIERTMAQTYPDLEVLVVDQTPTHAPELNAFLHNPTNRFRYIHLPIPSITAARNAGVRASTGDVIFFVDDDVEIPINFVEKLVEHFRSPTIGGVMALLVPPGDTDLVNVRIDATRLFEAANPLKEGDVTGVNWMSNSAVAYSRQSLFDAGLFDEYFQRSAWCEDADMSIRVRRLGLQLLIDTRMHVTHLSLNEGGCGNRDPLQREQTERDHMDFFHYFVLKNRHFLGVRRVSHALIQQYRQYAMNRSTVTRGWSDLWRRHARYLASVHEAYRACGGKT